MSRWCSCWPWISTRRSPRRSRRRNRRGRVVDEHAVPAGARELALDDELAVGGGMPGLVERGGHRARGGDVEHGLDRGGLRARADEIGLGAGAADQEERVDDDGLAGPGLAGEDVQPRREDDARFFEDGQVADGELAEHRGRHATTRETSGSRRILRVTGRRRPAVRSTLALAPLELGPQHGEEVLLREAEEADPRRGLVDRHDVGLLQREADLPVER